MCAKLWQLAFYYGLKKHNTTKKKVHELKKSVSSSIFKKCASKSMQNLKQLLMYFGTITSFYAAV